MPEEAAPDLPLVSVITRTRDRRQMLREAADSVRAQTWPSLQYVVVNDGGEPVDDILEPLRGRMEVTLLDPGRVGRCRAGNLGLEAATGEWIAWLDDDDAYEPDHLKVMLEALAGSGKKAGYSDAWRVDLASDGKGGWRETARSVPYSEDFDRLNLFQRAYIHIVTFVHHREAYERLGGFDEDLEVLEDWDLFFRYAQDYDFLHVPKTTARFHVRDDSSNAITMYRREFVDTRARLFTKYGNIAFRELMALLEKGRQEFAGLSARVERLEQQLRERGEEPRP